MNINELLKELNIDAETISAVINDETAPVIASILHVDERLITAAAKLIPLFFGGDLDMKSLVAALIPAALSYIITLKTSGDDEDETISAQKNTPERREGCEKSDNTSELDEFLRTEKNMRFSPVDLYLQNSSAS